jgi:menaquinone-9 beta-reductase
MCMRADVLVLGAGPAGIAASMLLANQGLSVEIIDPAIFPRTKICGEFLNPQAVQWLNDQRLLESLLQLNPFPIHGMKISDSSGGSFTGRYTSSQKISGYAVMRKMLDSLLVEKVLQHGIALHQGWKAQKLLFENEMVTGVSGVDPSGAPFEKHAQIVIGADGRNNLIGRTFGWIRGIRSLRKYAFQTHFENLPHLSHFGEIHIIRGGYIGIAPLSESLCNVAVVMDESVFPSGDADREKFMLENIHSSRLSERFNGLKPASTILAAGPLAFETVRVSGHRCLLVGDTCGFVDPFTGEGINYAFLSAGVAADVLKKAFHTRNFDDAALSEYDHLRKALFGKKFLIAKILQKAIARPGAAVFLVKRFARSLELGDTIISAVGSAIPVEEVFNFRFLMKLVLS